MAIKARPPYFPGDELVDVTPSSSTDIPGIPSDGCKIHNKGTSGLVFVDGALSGANISLYLRQGDWAPVMVKRVRSVDSGVLIVASW